MVMRRQVPVQIEEIRERGDGRDDATHELYETRSDQIPDAFRVGHDAGDQNARLGRIEIADRQPRHVCLDPPAHLGDGSLRGHAEHLRERERRHRPHERRKAGDQSERHQHLRPLLPDDVVDEKFGGCRQHEPRGAIDEHED